MKLAVRLALGALLVASVAWKLSVDEPPLGREANQAALAAAVGAEAAGPVTHRKYDMTIRVKGCPEPLTVWEMSPSFSASGTLNALGADGSGHLFAYLDWTSREQDRVATLGRFYLDKVLALTGLSPYRTSKFMLLITEPQGCDIAASIPWRRYWLKF